MSRLTESTLVKFLSAYLFSFIILLIVFFVYLNITLPNLEKWNREIPQKTDLMAYRINNATINRNNIRYSWIPLSQIPKRLQRCVIVSEDASFWGHEGIDWFEIKQSFKRNIEDKEFSRGGSTITQQLVKNLYLSPQKSIHRKISELYIAHKLEDKLSKSKILELYLNVVEWGNHVYGIKAASMRYFGKMPKSLVLHEMVRLAAVLPNPKRLSPNNLDHSLRWRSNIILERLKRFNFITNDRYETTSKKLKTLFHPQELDSLSTHQNS